MLNRSNKYRQCYKKKIKNEHQTQEEDNKLISKSMILKITGSIIDLLNRKTSVYLLYSVF